MSKSLKPRLAIALVHYPILDREKEIVATNVTNFDIHDIARAARMYGAEKYYIIHPMQEQLMFVERVLDHWRVGQGSQYNPSRKEALSIVQTAESFEKALKDWGVPEAQVVTTHARTVNGAQAVTFSALRDLIHDDKKPCFLVFGTGYGLTDDFMSKSGLVLESIRSSGVDDFRHLSVRSAVSICLDRLMGAC